MSRPTNKNDLLTLSQKNYKNLNNFVDSFTEEDKKKEFLKGTMNRNFRDVLAHLHHWHLMMLEWYSIGMKGEKPDIPAKGYTWKTTPELNRKIWESYRTTDIKEVRPLLDKSFRDIQKIIEKHSDAELFENQPTLRNRQGLPRFPGKIGWRFGQHLRFQQGAQRRANF